jgi:hypothetical protein
MTVAELAKLAVEFKARRIALRVEDDGTVTYLLDGHPMMIDLDINELRASLKDERS